MSTAEISLPVYQQERSAASLLVTASLFARSLQNTVEVDVGFEPQDRLSVSVDLSFNGYEEERRRRFYADLRTSVERLPQVRSATWAMPMPLDTFASNAFVYVDGHQRTDDRAEPLQVLFSSIDENYFDTLGTPILRGRGIEANDRRAGSRVAVINQTMADRYWPDEAALGGSFRLDEPDGPLIRVVGIAADGRYRRVAEAPIPYVFLPYEQGAAISANRSWACSRVLPGASLPTAQMFRRLRSSRSSAASGRIISTLESETQNSAWINAWAPRKPGGVTPITVKGWLLK